MKIRAVLSCSRSLIRRDVQAIALLALVAFGFYAASGVPAASAAPERYTGMWLSIESADVSTQILATVMEDGQMPTPADHHKALMYDFSKLSNKGSYGGDQTAGNLVLSGWIDYPQYDGHAAFWNVDALLVGDTAVLHTLDSREITYVVKSAQVLNGKDVKWDAVVASDAADMTIIACSVTNRAGAPVRYTIVALTRV